jgi:Asp-tRNA(Asn)/Glu-tRNA(Gln) amidotransferase A subunit family amidase
MVPFAIGSETSGSIVTPASYCGVTALRPTYGLVSRYGAMALSWTLDKLGPFAHSAEDCGLILQAIAGKRWQRPGLGGQELLLHAPICAVREGAAHRLRTRRISPNAPMRPPARRSTRRSAY